MADASTPLMRQYHSVKQQFPGTLLLFRLGDFYELFFDDAVTAARELEITLTARNKEKGAAIPMCGVPYHAADGYVSRLLQRGYRVAICEQMEDPKLTKKLVKREVTRVLTPGTAMDANLVRAAREQLSRRGRARGWPRRVGARGYLDGRVPRHRTRTGRGGCAPSSILARAKCCFPATCRWLPPTTVRAPASFAPKSKNGSSRRITPIAPCATIYKLLSLDGFGLANRPAAVGAAGAILHYLRETQRASLDHLDRPAFYNRADSMVLDAVTVRNLELIEPIFAADAHQSQATLINVLDQTQTGMGGRLLRQRLLRPSMDRAEIEQRLDALGELLQQTILRAEIRKELAGYSRSGAPAREDHAGHGRSARRSGARPVARKDSRAETMLRHAAGSAPARAARAPG